jgi:uncharacterized membrane protein YccC
VAGFVKEWLRFKHPLGWIDELEILLLRELAPSFQKFRTALRLTVMATIGAGLVVSCHVNNELGTYIVWLLVGAGPMMTARRAAEFLTAEALAVMGSIVMARALAETPWLMLPFIFALFSFSTYLGNAMKFGPYLLLIQVVCLAAYYGVVFAPQEIGWDGAGAFGGTAIAFGVLVLFDQWLWPDPAEPQLMKSLGASVAGIRSRLLEASRHYLDGELAPEPPVPPPTSDLPAHMALLNQAVVEGISEHRHAILLAAITRVARIYLEVDRLVVAARESVPRKIRDMARTEIGATVDSIAAVLEELAREFPHNIAVGVDEPPPPSRKLAREATDELSARILQIKPAYIETASPAEIANFASFTDCLALLTEHIDRLLDEPPQPSVPSPPDKRPQLTPAPDPALMRYSFKVGLCAVVGYVIGIASQRPELSTILTTVLITALPTYGAAVRKMILRIVGAAIGGAISLLVIIIVSPNFATLPAYLLAVFIIFYLSAYCSLTSGRIAYAGKQIGTTFALVFTGLSPSADIYVPLWRIWSILLGTFVVAIITLILWPEYAGDSLLPRLRRVILDTLALAPGGSSANTENEIQQTNSEAMRTLAEILGVADDAQLEGRASLVDHNSIVQAAGALRRIANRFSSIATGRIVTPLPQLDPTTESARASFFAAMRQQLESWLNSFSGADTPYAAQAQAHSEENLQVPLQQFSSRLEEQGFARIESWTLEQRRTILAELQSMRRLEFLFSDMNRWLGQILGPALNPGTRIGIRQSL